MTNPAATGLLVLAIAASVATRSHVGARLPQSNTTAQLSLILGLEDARAPHPDDVRALVRTARDGTGEVQVAAIRALGRLERRDVVAELLPLLGERARTVRAEAANAVAQARQQAQAHGCAPLVDRLADDSMHVVLAATDLLGRHCPTDSTITDRLTAEARTPPARAWHREAHGFVALARRSPERARLAMPAFVSHASPHVRTYAARAAAILDDATTLQRLAADEDDNVAEAALPPLRRLLGPESDPLFIAALNRRPRTAGRHRFAYPYQVLRTAAIELKGATTSPPLVGALVAALQRVTADNHETSRDVRLALIERIQELGKAELAPTLTPLLRDFDPVVAAAAADAIARWMGTRPDVPVQPVRRPAILDPSESRSLAAVLVLGSGRRVEIAFLDEAPLTRTRFVQLARSGYSNGLTFHRVEPNFVIQGGSPNAHEYVGDRLFMRDEVGLGMHHRGAIGISTRGRDTGDAQIFINLVDNPRLDHDYTVFAYVQRHPRDQKEIVDGILEGDVIARVEIIQRR